MKYAFHMHFWEDLANWANLVTGSDFPRPREAKCTKMAEQSVQLAMLSDWPQNRGMSPRTNGEAGGPLYDHLSHYCGLPTVLFLSVTLVITQNELNGLPWT